MFASLIHNRIRLQQARSEPDAEPHIQARGGHGHSHSHNHGHNHHHHGTPTNHSNPGGGGGSGSGGGGGGTTTGSSGTQYGGISGPNPIIIDETNSISSRTLAVLQLLGRNAAQKNLEVESCTSGVSASPAAIPETQTVVLRMRPSNQARPVLQAALGLQPALVTQIVVPSSQLQAGTVLDVSLMFGQIQITVK